MWNDRNVCINWDDTVEWFNLLGVTSVPVLYDGIFHEATIRALHTSDDWSNKEGYVMRVADPILYGEFRNMVGKVVRKNHIQTVKHWMYGQAIEPNLLSKDAA